MDCEQIRELLDGYALGASDSQESRLVEEHVAVCLRCWDELSVSQATAALLALSVRIETPRAALENTIMRLAQKDLKRTPERVPFWRRLTGSPWPATAGAFGAVSAVALVVSGMLFFEVQDVQSRNDSLETQIQAAAVNFERTSELTANQLAEQGAIMAILSDSDHEQVEMMPRGDSNVSASYTWSAKKGAGALLCQGMPKLEPGKVYMSWIKVGNEEYPLKPFLCEEGCQIAMDMAELEEAPDGIGITIEDAPGHVTEPNTPWFMYGKFTE